MFLGRRLVSIFFVIFSCAYMVSALLLPMGKASKPGPGLVPVGIGIFLSFFALLHIVEVFRSSRREFGEKEEGFPKREDFYRVMGVILVLVFYLIFLGFLGYILSTIVLVGAVLRLLHMQGWKRIVFLSILTPVCSYYFFNVFLDVPLPQGIFSF